MTVRALLRRIGAQEDLNFLLTNRIPRHALTRFMGWFAKIEQPLVRYASLRLWRTFSEVDLSDAAETEFRSLHAAFVRRLRPGARSVDPDPDVIVSPSDAILGAHGPVRAGALHQIKGFPYTLTELLGHAAEVAPFLEGSFATLRLTAGMYHRFHAPADLVVEQVRYISGDTWNVNPITLRRIEKLFCRNERAPIAVRLRDSGLPLLMVPVAAVLVASIRLPFLGDEASARSLGDTVVRPLTAFRKGDEMGWFEHGSTILLFAPPGMRFVEGPKEGQAIRAGQPLFRAKAGTSVPGEGPPRTGENDA